MNINKFLNAFNTFVSHERTENLSDEAKISLFKVYCDINFKESNPVNSRSRSSSRRRSNNPPPISGKQRGLIKSLIEDGHLDDQDLDNLNIKQASDLIEVGLNNKNNANNEEEENETEFAGSYNTGSLFE